MGVLQILLFYHSTPTQNAREFKNLERHKVY